MSRDPMKLLAGVDWAILPEKLEAIAAYLSERAESRALPQGPAPVAPSTPDLTAESAALQGGPARATDPQPPYLFHSHVAYGDVGVVPLHGTLLPRASGIDAASGAVSMERLMADVANLGADPAIGGILLDVQSPGGTVAMTQELALTVRAAAGIKPVVAHVTGQACSAAYWIASAATAIVAGETASIGSIGVITVHRDQSALDAQIGLKYTTLAAGKYKATGDPHAPLSPDDEHIIQTHLNDLYALFIRDVATFRDIPEATVREDLADGRIFLANAALEAGLIDQVGNRTEALAMFSKLRAFLQSTRTTAASAGATASAPAPALEAAAPATPTPEPITAAEAAAVLPDLAKLALAAGLHVPLLFVEHSAETDAEADALLTDLIRQGKLLPAAKDKANLGAALRAMAATKFTTEAGTKTSFLAAHRAEFESLPVIIPMQALHRGDDASASTEPRPETPEERVRRICPN